MGASSAIEWTDATWPVVKGCDYVSPGCANCYAAGLIHRRAANPNPKISLPLAGLTNERGRWTGKVYLNEPHLMDPVKWKKGRMIFVPSHGDMFHEDVPDAFIRRVFGVMSLCGQHTFQVLTKRPERMAAFFADPENDLSACQAEETVFRPTPDATLTPTGQSRVRDLRAINGTYGPRVGEGNYWPLPNVWLGFSAENQEWFDRRAVHMAPLMRAGWTVFVSAEPLLGPILMTGWDGTVQRNWLDDAKAPGIRWVITGGESGVGARPSHPDWFRGLRDQCRRLSVAFFHKQNGEYVWDANDPWGNGPSRGTHTFIEPACIVKRVGKKAAGRLLDGMEHSAFPTPAGPTA